MCGVTVFSVVVLQPGRQCGGAGGVVEEDVVVDLLGLQGVVESLYFAVLPGTVGFDRLCRAPIVATAAAKSREVT